MGMDYIAGLRGRGAGRRQDRQGQSRQGPAQRRAHRSGRSTRHRAAGPRGRRGGARRAPADDRRACDRTGYIEELFVNKTGQHVHAGEPLFRVYSPRNPAGADRFLVAIGAVQRGVLGVDANVAQGAMQRLRNLGVPESRIREVRETGTNPRTLDWPAPATGDVIEKRVINGKRVIAGDELYRIADHSHRLGDRRRGRSGPARSSSARAPSSPCAPIRRSRSKGEVTFIYPGAEGRDEHGARAHRAAKSRTGG